MATNYPIIQSNGQRIYIPDTCKQCKTPPRGCEIFIGNLPRDLYEEELIPLFNEVGPIHKLRLMMDFSGMSRGFAFIHYHSVEDANLAVERLNDYPIRKKGRVANYITVHISIDNCRLFFGNVPRDWTTEDVEEALKKIVDGVVKVILYPQPRNEEFNRGFAFAEFETHAMAAIARRRLLAGVVRLWDNTSSKVCVDWAEPEPIVSPAVLKQVKILFFKNVPASWTLDRFKQFFRNSVKDIEVARTYKRDNYAFVHFFTRCEAERALKMIQSISDFLVHNGQRMEVEWARPTLYSRRNRAKSFPDNLCVSVPPQVRKQVIRAKKEHTGKPKSGFNSKPANSETSEESSGSDLLAEIDKISVEDFLTEHMKQLSLFSDILGH